MYIQGEFIEDPTRSGKRLMPAMYCPRCRTKYKDAPTVCKYCDIPLVEQLPSRTLTDYTEGSSWRDDDEYEIEFPDEEHEDHEEPQDLGTLSEQLEDQKIRVRLLNRYLVLRVLWFAAWLAAGFFTAYHIVPDDSGEGTRLLVYTASMCAALVLSNLILKVRSRHYPPGTDDAIP